MSKAKPCPNVEHNNARCTCTHTDCQRHGICCECVAFHLASKTLTQCYVKAGLELK